MFVFLVISSHMILKSAGFSPTFHNIYKNNYSFTVKGYTIQINRIFLFNFSLATIVLEVAINKCYNSIC